MMGVGAQAAVMILTGEGKNEAPNFVVSPGGGRYTGSGRCDWSQSSGQSTGKNDGVFVYRWTGWPGAGSEGRWGQSDGSSPSKGEFARLSQRLRDLSEQLRSGCEPRNGQDRSKL
jgi:hypothetical protein